MIIYAKNETKSGNAWYKKNYLIDRNWLMEKPQKIILYLRESLDPKNKKQKYERLLSSKIGPFMFARRASFFWSFIKIMPK